MIPTELDVFAPERWVDDALFRPESRDAFARLLARGWADALRRMHPEERIYTFWDYFDLRRRGDHVWNSLADLIVELVVAFLVVIRHQRCEIFVNVLAQLPALSKRFIGELDRDRKSD